MDEADLYSEMHTIVGMITWHISIPIPLYVKSISTNQKFISCYCNLIVVHINRNMDHIILPKVRIWFEFAKINTPNTGYSHSPHSSYGHIQPATSHNPTPSNMNHCHRNEDEATIQSIILLSTSRCCCRPSLAHQKQRCSCIVSLPSL